MMKFTVRLYDDSYSSFESIEAESVAAAIPLAREAFADFLADSEDKEGAGWDLVPADDELTDKPLATGRMDDAIT